MARHECNKVTNGKDWHYCGACDGRIHLPGCTTKLNPKKDCCVRRHKMLLAEGHTEGLADSSQPMWDEYWQGLEDAGMEYEGRRR